MARISILHISDLHISAADAKSQQIVLKALWADLHELRQSGCSIDLVFFSGDLVAKGDYSPETQKLLKEIFFTPLLEATNLPATRLFLCPGNHDVSLPDRSSLLNTLFDSINSEESLSGFFTGYFKTPIPSGLEPFNQLVDSLELSPPVLKTQFFRGHLEAVSGVKIAICAINSAWRATGAPNDGDYGRLAIGRYQLDELSTVAERGDISLGLFHHPINWLSPFDYNVTQRQLYLHFDGVFYGHNHEADGNALAGSIGSYFASNAGCLYQSRDYYNGYSIVTFDTDTREWIVNAREYFESRQAFDASARFAPNGRQIYLTAPRENSAPLQIPSSEFIASVLEETSSHLLSASVSKVAPKSLHEIFVEPPISYISQRQISSEQRNSEASLYLKLSDILAIKKPVFIVGPKQAGKTTLLHRLCCQVGELGVLNFPPFSAYVDLRNAHDTRSRLIDAMLQFSGNSYKRQEFLQLMREGLVAVCFDNLNLDRSRQLNAVSELVREFPKCRFFCAVREDIQSSLTPAVLPSFDVETEVLYLHSFGRKETRALAAKWFGSSDPLRIEVIDNMLSSLRRLNIPRTPFLISAMLWIRESQLNFEPVNHAAIVDALIDGVLEKLTESKTRSTLDSTNKRDYLAHLAEHLYRADVTRIGVVELEKFTIAYFENRALNSSIAPFIEEMKARGLLIERDGYVGFKFDCMRAFFLSIRLGSSQELLDQALTVDRFVRLDQELDYLTGITRNRKDVLTRSLTLMESLHATSELHLDLELFDDVSLTDSPFEEQEKAVLSEKIFSSRLLGEKREEALDNIDKQAQTQLIADANASKSGEIEPPQRYIRGLEITSTILRNSELVDDVALKDRAYNLLTGYWCELLIAVLACVDFLEEEPTALEALASLLPFGNKSLIAYFLRLLLPNVVINEALEKLGTGKLQLTIEKAIASDAKRKESARRVFDTFLYVDLDLPERLTYLEGLLVDYMDNRFIAELVLLKLAQLYMFKTLSDAQESDVRRLLTKALDIVFKAKGTAVKGSLKNRVLASFQRQRLVQSGSNTT